MTLWNSECRHYNDGNDDNMMHASVWFQVFGGHCFDVKLCDIREVNVTTRRGVNECQQYNDGNDDNMMHASVWFQSLVDIVLMSKWMIYGRELWQQGGSLKWAQSCPRVSRYKRVVTLWSLVCIDFVIPIRYWSMSKEIFWHHQTGVANQGKHLLLHMVCSRLLWWRLKFF